MEAWRWWGDTSACEGVKMEMEALLGDLKSGSGMGLAAAIDGIATNLRRGV